MDLVIQFFDQIIKSELSAAGLNLEQVKTE